MDLNLKDKIIVVSGATDIEGIVKLLAAEGAVPVIISGNENNNLKTAASIKTAGGNCFQVVAELTKPEECEKSVQKIIKELGRIDGLVNNNGINDDVSLEHGSSETFFASLHKNLVHYYLLSHYALPALKKSKGVIVNISSKPIQGNTYAANDGRKALTREWAVELLKYGIRVNAVIINEDNLTERLKKEIANTVAFLLSEKSSHTTGQLIHVNSALPNA